MVVLFLTFWGSSILFYMVVAPIYIPMSSAQGFPFLHIIADLLFVVFVMTAILTGVRWYFIVVFICISQMVSDLSIIFSCACWPSVCLLSENVLFKSSAHFLKSNFLVCLFLMLNCMSSLYILGINCLSDSVFANVFFHSISFLFLLLIISFAVQKLLVDVSFCLFLLFFPLAWVDRSRKLLLKLMSESVLPVSSRSFKASGLRFKSDQFWVYFFRWYRGVV